MTTYTLPTTSNPGGPAVAITNVYECGKTSTPSWMSFTDSSNLVLKFNKPPLSAIGTHSFCLDLTDGVCTNTFSFTVEISATSYQALTNIGPPVFDSPLPQISLTPNQTLTYKIPSISDPDNDNFSVTV